MTAALIGWGLLAAGLGVLVVFVALVVDADRDAIDRARLAVRVDRVRAYATPAKVDPREYAARRSAWPRRVTPSELEAWHPWRVRLVAGMGWLTNGHRHVRLAEPAPEIIRRLRRERALREPTGEFRALVSAALFDLAAAAIGPARDDREEVGV